MGVIVVLAISAALMSFYRGVALREIEEVGERNTATIARYVATLVGPDSVQALRRADPGEIERLQLKLARLRVNLGLKSISVQDAGGTVRASTTPADIGRNLREDEGFERAARGESASELVFRNRASRFERRTPDADIVHSYVPLRADASSPVAGVLEVYADVTPLVSRMEFALTEIVVAGVVAFLLAYGALVLVVKRAARTIEGQQREIEAKTAQLRELSSQLQDSEERERQRLAEELHEGVAQTLAAVKYAVETATVSGPIGSAGPWPTELSNLVPTIQEAIRDVRSIATDLRPPRVWTISACCARCPRWRGDCAPVGRGWAWPRNTASTRTTSRDGSRSWCTASWRRSWRKWRAPGTHGRRYGSVCRPTATSCGS